MKNRKSYVIYVTKSASDETLTELAQYIHLQPNQEEVQINTDFWGLGRFKLFISHLSEHQAYAAQLQEELNKYGISCFVALGPGAAPWRAWPG